MGEGTFTTGVGVFERPPLGYSVVDRVEKAKVGAELGTQHPYVLFCACVTKRFSSHSSLKDTRVKQLKNAK